MADSDLPVTFGCDCANLRARLAVVEAERARLAAEVEHGYEQVARWNRSFLAADRRAVAAEARLDAIEGDRDTWRHRAEMASEILTLRARLAEVEAELDECVHPVWQLDGYSKTDCFDHGVDVVKARVRAAARGESDRG